MADSTRFIAYFGPETLLPLTSIVATIAGIVIMIGQGSIRFVLHCIRRRHRRQNGVAGVSYPHGVAADHERLLAPVHKMLPVDRQEPVDKNTTAGASCSDRRN